MRELKWLWPYPQKVKLNGKFTAPSKLIFKGNIPDILSEDITNVENENYGTGKELDVKLSCLNKNKIPGTTNVETGGACLKENYVLNKDHERNKENEKNVAADKTNVEAGGACLKENNVLDKEKEKDYDNDDTYRITINESEAQIIGTDEAGLCYGINTFLQIISLMDEKEWPVLEIEDWPTYKTRSFMIDMGRSVYTIPMMKRTIRILHRLKMNQLHLHLYDDELCGIKFKGLPFGYENSHAISLDQLKEIIEYANKYHVTVVPELEAWGHAASIAYHDKSIKGGDGVYDGASFLISEKTFTLFEKMISQLAEILPNNSVIHLGLDEAKWFPDNSLPEGFSPSDMIERYYNIIQKSAIKTSKKFRMCIWVDHPNRQPVPEHLEDKILLEPWCYWDIEKDIIRGEVDKYSSVKNIHWLGAGGISGHQHLGSHAATKHWAKYAVNSTNVEGINIAFWMWNDLDRKFMSLFSGAYFIWNPTPDTELADMAGVEEIERHAYPIMYWWQDNFRDAFPPDIAKDRGPIVCKGFYMWNEKHGKPVAPTVKFANTYYGHSTTGNYKNKIRLLPEKLYEAAKEDEFL